MKPNSLFAILAILGIIAFLPESDKPDTGTRHVKLLSDLNPADLARIKITPKLGDSVELVRKGDTWNVESYNNFPADPSKISSLVQNLFLLKLGERETSGSKYYDNYGVNTDGPTRGLLLSLSKSDGSTASEVVFGNDRMAKGQYGFDTPVGQYMRISNSEEIYLLKEKFSVETIPSNWIYKKLPAISEGEVQKIVVDTGVETFQISRLEKAKEFTMEGLDPEQEINKSKVEQLVSTFKDFSFNNLEKPGSVASTKSMTNISKFELQTFDGMKLSVEMGVKTTASSYRFARLKWSGINPAKEIQEKINLNNNLFKDWLIGFTDYSGKTLFPSKSEMVRVKPLGAKHILLAYEGASNSKANRSKQEALELANKIIADLKSGQTFEKLAADYSDDASNKNKGGSLGEFGKGDMVKPFEEATYALAVGETTDSPVETVYGFHVIQRTK